MATAIGLFALGILMLWAGSEFVTRNIGPLARSLGVKELVITALGISVLSSLPELTLSLFALAKGDAAISLGNIIGSNFVTLTFVTAICALVRPINIHEEVQARESSWMILSSSFVLLLAMDGRLSRSEGVLLILLYLPYVLSVLKTAREEAQNSPDGPLPRISDNGRKPFDVYSQVTPLAVSTSARPKITILLGGMGLNARLTDRAIKELPGDISFGFAPYGDNLQEQVNRARGRGHEIMLQVPMEPVGYPGNNPGPNTILTDATEDANLTALRWHMSRFAGYSGVTNYMGARLLVTEEAMKPVMQELKKRGLVYFEDATVNLTLSPKVVQQLRLPMQRATMVIDSDPTAPAIAEALHKLEAEAVANGSAIGTGSGLEVTIDTVAEWAKGLQEKGILLVPVSAAYKGRAT